MTAVADRKHVAVAYVALVWLGWVGGHRIYLGYRRTGIAMLVTSLTGLAFFIVSSRGVALPGMTRLQTGEISVLMMLATLAWQIVDIFLIPSMVRRQNQNPAAAPGLAVR